MGDPDPERDRVREVLDHRDGSTAGLAEWRQLKSHLTAQQITEEKMRAGVLSEGWDWDLGGGGIMSSPGGISQDCAQMQLSLRGPGQTWFSDSLFVQFPMAETVSLEI